MDNSWLVATLIFALWLFAFSLQLGDLSVSWLSGRVARVGTRSGRLTRERITGLFWVPPFVALVVVGEGMGIAFALRLLVERDAPLQAALVVLALAVVGTGAWLIVVFATTRPDLRGYRDVTAEISSMDGERVAKEVAELYRDELDLVDDSVAPAPRATRAWRVVPVLIGIAAFATGWIATAESISRHGWVTADAVISILSLVALPALSFALTVLTTKIAAASASSWHLVHAARRAEAVAAIDNLERRSSKRVAGLGDRVSRALQILREQQGD